MFILELYKIIIFVFILLGSLNKKVVVDRLYFVIIILKEWLEMFFNIGFFVSLGFIGGSLINILLYRIEIFFVLIFVLICSYFVIK